MRITLRRAFACLGVLFALSTSITAQAEGVLDRIAKGAPLVIAHREASIPFSYVQEGKPVGYALELCLRIAEQVRKQTGAKDMPVQLMQVTPANRVEMVKSGKADLECGSTTNNATRRKDVSFTMAHFITGARILVAADSKIDSVDDLAKKNVVSTKGTTPLAALEQLNRARYLQMTILTAPDHAAAFEMVQKGQADAFVMDDVLLAGLAASSTDPKAVKLVGRFLTTEPLAIMLPKDDLAFKKLVDDEMRRMIKSGEINALYDKWFTKPIPPMQRSLDLPTSYLLRDFWKYPTDQLPG
ncbi:amino acid ABC transporter substrate-binding protein [Diaphorobacter sp. HDW4A]|uniref:amino acid ABC transporter substrate-binding protein n=1 Tax=Diaphorobacter sp. HDW4A TaxID=2714924 RepID=UPI00140763F6|nr:amino acid ABC transporter substrate-binding protein [Diaphorobacter sp. HDW4A]QIL81744.1 amino acid ABC transporter substrate-binding protein [Diaphorobacter sp. HDW4A]